MSVSNIINPPFAVGIDVEGDAVTAQSSHTVDTQRLAVGEESANNLPDREPDKHPPGIPYGAGARRC